MSKFKTIISIIEHYSSPWPSRFATAKAGTSVGKTRYFLPWLLWLCRATAKIKLLDALIKVFPAMLLEYIHFRIVPHSLDV